MKFYLGRARRLWWLILILPVILLQVIEAFFIHPGQINQRIGGTVVALLGVVLALLVVEMIRRSRRIPTSFPPKPRKTLEPLTFLSDDQGLAA